ncbi:hypothetical protein [Novipirellula sp.]|uniref:hypothetical protein n=1 Tax=Novipirellula sp. TaxID=2795430 RepID=UPI0035615A53
MSNDRIENQRFERIIKLNEDINTIANEKRCCIWSWRCTYRFAVTWYHVRL